ncbi:MAG: aminoglycoside phosphotransferase family protein [Terracidiphilus sp.]
MNQENSVGAATRHFAIDGKFTGAAPYGSGHINDSYCAVFQQNGKEMRYIVQRMNHHIFKNPVALMENVERVTAHLAQQLNGQSDSDRRVLSLIPARDGRAWYMDEGGNYWRAYRFIENARSYDAVETAQQAYQAGRAFGRFQQMLAGLPAPRLHDTIPDFHNTTKRFEALQQAITADVANRAALAKAEIDFALKHESIVGVLMAANLPERVTHNDTKFNNVLLDDATGEGICVIDLDTVMPGLAAYDFGDMVRTTTSPAMEDERDLSKVEMNFSMFEALVRGYLEAAGTFLTNAEKRHLAFSGKLITFEIGVRFLTDYLSGDTYFKVHREGHNLDRCRTQFKLVESLESQEDKMHRLVKDIC